MRPLVPHDNASNLQGYLPHCVLTAEVLDGLGIADGVGPLEFTFAQGGQVAVGDALPRGGAVLRLDVHDPLYGHYPSILPRRKPTPLYLRKSASLLWVGTLDRGSAVFVGFNAVRLRARRSSTASRSARARPQVKRVIVDLRLNGGGDNTTYGSLLRRAQRLERQPEGAAVRPHRPRDVLGRSELRRRRRPAHEGDVRRRADGRLRRGYGDTRFPAPEERDQRAHRGALLGLRQGTRATGGSPSTPTARSTSLIADFLAGRDPVLAAALKG